MANLKKIEFSGNKIEKIPSSLNKNTLTVIDLKKNQLKEIPQFIFELPLLHELELSYNQIEKLHLEK